MRRARSRRLGRALSLSLLCCAAPAAAQTITIDRVSQRDGDAFRATIKSVEMSLDALREVMPAGWIGILSQGPSRQFVDDDGLRVTYLAYPTILSVDPRSPAERAGVAPGDVLVAYNGVDVVGREFNLTRLLVPDTRLEVTVRRDGEKKDYAIDVAKAPESVFRRRLALERMPAPKVVVELPHTMVAPRRAPSAPRAFIAGTPLIVSARGAFGASLSAVGPELAHALQLEQGLLVNDVSAPSPASEAGLRAGDVIVSAGAHPVATLDALQNLVVAHLGDRAIVLQIVRDHKSKRVTVTW